MITVDSIGTLHTSAGGTSLTFSHTVNGSNRMLAVMAADNRGQGSGGALTAITYAGVDISPIQVVISTSVGVAVLFLALAPTLGTNNLVLTFTNPGAAIIEACAISYNGVLQSGLPDAQSTGGPTFTTSYSQSVTTVGNNCWAILAGEAINKSTLTAGTNTQIISNVGGNLGSFFIHTNTFLTPPGIDTMNVTSSSQNFYGAMASFAPSLNSNSNLPLLRVG